jgi:outer membrane protein OmpA-like peptidoglycan-associated protein
MSRAALTGGLAALVLTLGAGGFVGAKVHAAGRRMTAPAATPAPAVADHAEAAYCTPVFKQVLQRVLNACGLVGTQARRGCQPSDVKRLASISGDDFNALFTPLADRGAIVLFDEGSEKLDDGAHKLIEEHWLDRRGARYFFVVARGSHTGTAQTNRALSHKRANSVLFQLSELSHDPALEKQVGLLWLGKEFAQLPKTFCTWPNSRADKSCNQDAINRSAFVSWVDCRL